MENTEKPECKKTIYAYEKSIKMDEDRQNSVRRSIENERNKAGILLGFFFLVLINGMQYIEQLPSFLSGICLLLIIYTFRSLYIGFTSTKMDDGVLTNNNFKEDWEQRSKEKFLEFHHEILDKNIENQKKHLTRLSSEIKKAAITLFIIIIIIFLNSNLRMVKTIFDDDIKDNPMTSEIHEQGVKPTAISSDGSGNPMGPDHREKGK
jgi:hypothetical protein